MGRLSLIIFALLATLVLVSAGCPPKAPEAMAPTDPGQVTSPPAAGGGAGTMDQPTPPGTKTVTPTTSPAGPGGGWQRGGQGGGMKGGKGRGGMGRFFTDLDPKQRKQAEDKIAELRAKNASRQEIMTAVRDLYKSWGKELPRRGGGAKGGGMGGGKGGGMGGAGGGKGGFQATDWLGKLTTEQQKQVRDKMAELHGKGASREEVRAAVGKMLKSWGVGMGSGGGGDKGGAGGASGPSPHGAGNGTRF